jgi:UrcA family protein
MPRLSNVKFPVLLAGAFGLAFAASSAMAQDNGYSGMEEVPVYAPHYSYQPGAPLNVLPEKISLSSAVRYDDLDLRSWQGARELRRRIRREAVAVCVQLADDYPVYTIPGPSCYKGALDDAMVRADHIIADARRYED